MSKYRLVKTVVVFVATIVLGIHASIIPTTLPDMEARTCTNTAEMSTLFIWAGLARIVATLTIGSLFDRVNGMLLMALCLAVMGVTLALAPTWPNMPAFHALATVSTGFQTCLLSGAITIIKNLWQGSSVWFRPLIQTSHLTTMFGLTIGPQIARPFVGHYANHTSAIAGEDNSTAVPTFHGWVHPVQVIYFIGGAIDVALATVCVIISAWSCTDGDSSTSRVEACLRNSDKYSEDIQLIPDSTKTPEDQSDKTEPPSSSPGCTLLVVILLIFISITGFDNILSSLLFTYVYEYLGWTVGGGTMLMTGYNAMRMAAQSTAVVGSCWISPTRVIVFSVACVIISSILMLAGVSNGEVAALTTIGVMVAGVSSPRFAAMITRVEETSDISAPVMAMIVSTYGMSYSTLTPLCGLLLHTVGAVSFPLLMLVISLATLALFAIHTILVRVMPSPG